MRVKIAPSILSSDFARLADEAARMEEAGADELHVDVMDGHFVPNLTVGPCVVSSLRSVTRLPLDVHLMISDPVCYADPFLDAGADVLTFHAETVDERSAKNLISRIKDRGRLAGVAISPPTSLELALPLLAEIDRLLVMTVQPGFGGQRFMRSVLEKVTRARAGFPDLDIEVDGGLNPATAIDAAAAGANVMVAGTAVFKAENAAEAVASLRRGAAENLLQGGRP